MRRFDSFSNENMTQNKQQSTNWQAAVSCLYANAMFTYCYK